MVGNAGDNRGILDVTEKLRRGACFIAIRFRGSVIEFRVSMEGWFFVGR